MPPLHGGLWCIPIGRAVSLIGGLSLVAAYFMPWFSVEFSGQGISLSGDFLGRFLGSTTDLRRFVPGASGGQTEVNLLRALVYLFPASGLLAAVLSLLGTLQSSSRRLVNATLVVLGILPLVALAGVTVAASMTRLPAAATPDVGLRLIAVGCIALLAGTVVDAFSARLSPEPKSEP